MLPIAILPRLDPAHLALVDPEAAPSLHWCDRETLTRMADEAERDGVTILRIASTGQHIAVPARKGATCHLVSPDRCSCRYHRVWGRCDHHALLLSQLGRIPDAPRDLLPAAAVREPAPHLRRVM